MQKYHKEIFLFIAGLVLMAASFAFAIGGTNTPESQTGLQVLFALWSVATGGGSLICGGVSIGSIINGIGRY